MVKKNFTRKDLSNNIYKSLGFSRNFSSTLVDDLFEILIQHLIKFNKIKISSFGTFEVINKRKELEEIQKLEKKLKLHQEKLLNFDLR